MVIFIIILLVNKIYTNLGTLFDKHAYKLITELFI